MLEMPLIDFDAFHRDTFPGRAAGPHGAAAAAAVRDLGALAFALPDGRAYTYSSGPAAITVAPGADSATVVARVSARAWSDVVQDIRTIPALIFAGALQLGRGTSDQLRRWQPALRALYSGIPIYDPTRVDLSDREGRPLDLQRSFALGDDDAAMAHFFRRTGFLHLRAVLSAAEIAALRADVDALQRAARPGDDRSWWAKDAGGRQVVCRLVYTGLASPRIAALADDPRLRRIAALSGLTLRPCVDRQEGQSVVIKHPGVVEGLADLPWHQDCGLGGHPIICPGIAIGIQLEAATADSGQLHFIAGTHGSTCHPFTDADLPHLPHIALTTAPGDCTLHIKDVVHRAPPPRGHGRRTLYVSFSPPAMFDHIGPGEAYNDIVRRRRPDGHVAHTDEVLAGRA
jgi:hypothetical protein